MSRWSLASFALLGFFLGAVACTHYVGRGSDLYYQGRYIEAAHVLEMSEQRLADADDGERASYGLYRGATLFRLGDLDGARRWLEYSERLCVSHSRVLRGEQHVLLEETMIAVHADLDRRAAARGF
jgi:tetratricopeptide (TPR) repeat protein